MSEKMLRVDVAELTTLRVGCQSPRCGAVVEVSLATFDKVFAKGYQCPVCGAAFGDNTPYKTSPDHLKQFVEAMVGLLGDAGRCSVQFALPLP